MKRYTHVLFTSSDSPLILTFLERLKIRQETFVSFLLLGNLPVLIDEVDNKIRLNCCFKKNVGSNLEMGQASDHGYTDYAGKKHFPSFFLNLKYKKSYINHKTI